MKESMLGRVVPCFVIVLLGFTSAIYAQKAGSAGPPATGTITGNTGAGAGTTGTNGTRGNPGTINPPMNNTNNNNPSNGTIFDQSRPIFLSGNVMFDDGSPLNSEIRIERVCNGNPQLETHTDSKGRFSFQVGGEIASSMPDIDASTPGYTGSDPLRGGNRSSLNQPGMRGIGPQGLMGCELRAAYPGYLSESVELSMHRSMDDPRIGTILLHRIGNVTGTTISVTTAQAPKSARKEFEKGSQLAQKGKFEAAEEKLVAAATEYPKFAAAWFALGQVQQKLNKPEDAKKSYLAATNADRHYVSPYDQLALLTAQQGKWEDAAKYSKEATDLNPVEFPSSFWYNALANYNLKNNAEAEKSAQALIKVDSRHRFPQAETMLAEFAANRGDLDNAAVHLRAFLSEAPNSTAAETVKKELTRIEEVRGTQAKSAPAAAH